MLQTVSSQKTSSPRNAGKRLPDIDIALTPILPSGMPHLRKRIKGSEVAKTQELAPVVNQSTSSSPKPKAPSVRKQKENTEVAKTQELAPVVNQSTSSSLNPKAPSVRKQKENTSSKNKKKSTTKVLRSTRKYRFRPGSKALLEIRRYQKSTDLLIPRHPFSRLVKEILAEFGYPDFRIQPLALAALQESTEAFITMELELSNLCTIHASRKTLRVADLQLTRRVRAEFI